MLEEKIDRFYDQVSNLSVLVIGETIIDEFIPVSYEGQSMKSICPVFKLMGEKKEQIGGTGAIAGHLKEFVNKVTIITNENKEIIKTRYVDIDDEKKHVEINRFDIDGFKEIEVDTKEYDVVIVADFGHGFCNKLNINDGFHLMCQTNSNNFGFNRVSKWKNHRKSSVCLDLREASLQMNKKIRKCTDKEVLELYNYEMQAEHLMLTIGKAGSVYSNGTAISRQISFESQIVDTIGAGDTFFAFASLTAHLQYSSAEILLIPSLAASLSTTWLCNERSVTPESLMEHASQYISTGVSKTI